MLAIVDLNNPLLWAVLIGWIMSVVLHEFAHGLVAYLGGDWTIKERGGLTLNPLQYIDPVFSLLIPAVIFIMGGVPLPGGVTYIRRDLIRTRAWQIATSAAGPAMNFLLFLILALPMHPKIGWIDTPFSAFVRGSGAAAELPNWMVFMAAMAWLQMLAVLFNLVPVPPLDGFQIIAEFMDEETRSKFFQAQQAIFFLFFLILWSAPAVFELFNRGVMVTMRVLGFDEATIWFFRLCLQRALYGD